MLSRDYRDIVGGALLLVSGLIYAWYAAGHYDLGTLRRMGPGMFPMALGLLLAFFGFLMIIPALFRAGEKPDIRKWSPLFVLAGVAAFAFTIRPFGLIPAVLAVTLISSLAELEVRPLRLATLSASLSLIAYLVFKVGLSLPVAMFRWPY